MIKEITQELDKIKEEVQIKNNTILSKESIIQQKIEDTRTEHWNWKENLRSNKDQIMLIRWQAKYCTWRPNYLTPCHKCGSNNNLWKHYMECNNMPMSIL